MQTHTRQNTQENAGELFTIAEAARLTGHTERAIRARADRGTLRTVKGSDNRRRIPRIDLIYRGLLKENESDRPLHRGSGNHTAHGAANSGTGNENAIAVVLLEKLEAALETSTQYRLLAVQHETRLSDATEAAERFRADYIEAAAEANKLKSRLETEAREAKELRSRLAAIELELAEIQAQHVPEVQTVADVPVRRSWFGLKRKR